MLQQNRSMNLEKGQWKLTQLKYKKTGEKKKQCISDLLDNIMWSAYNRNPGRRNKQVSPEELFEEIKVTFLPNLMKNINPQV